MALKVLLIDPCFDDKGLTNPAIPLSIGLIGSYLLKNVPEVDVKLLKPATQIIDYLSKEKIDVIGITTYVWNTNLGIMLSHYARKMNPDVLVVFGGPEITPKTLDTATLIKKFHHADLLVEHEGELAFTQIIQNFLEVKGDRQKIRERISKLGNSFFYDGEGQLVKGPHAPRILELDSIPSPYTVGLFDDFLKEKIFQPLIQTNRGCPYHCTFCHEGSEYFSKLGKHSVDYVKEELTYIAERVNPEVGLQIVDSNWGMYIQDVEIAKQIRHFQETKAWPLSIESNTGKSNPERIGEVAKILNGALMINNSMQSMSENVLKLIKRKNIKEIYDFVKSTDMVQQPELILPLPGETKESFISGLHRLLDSGRLIRMQVHPTMLLNNTEMYNQETVSTYALKTVYRQHSNLSRWLNGDFVCETEKIVISTSTMSQPEVLECRAYSMLLDTLLRAQPIWELFLFLEVNNISKSQLTYKLFSDLSSAPVAIQNCVNEFKNSLTEENFETEEELHEHMKNFANDYAIGRKGGGALKYSMMLWIEHPREMLSWVFNKAQDLFVITNEQTRDQLACLKKYMFDLYLDRFESPTANDHTDVFDYDLLSWSQSKELRPITDFHQTVSYRFQPTKISKVSTLDAWQSFGLYIGEGYDQPLTNGTRFYFSKLRRQVTIDSQGTQVYA